jgi:hypothetical protein
MPEATDSESSRRAARAAPALALALLLAFHLSTVWRGLDYGTHWDEHFLQTLLTDSVNDLDGWPRKYFYGSLYTGLGYLALAPDWIAALPELTREARAVGQYAGRIEPTPEMQAVQRALAERIQEPAFLVRTRALFALAATWGIVALFLAGRWLGGGAFGGVAAAAVLALSWEFNTHARHIAIDAVFVALVATCLALLARFAKPPPGHSNPDRFLHAAAAVAGLATGAKFHALLLLLPLAGVVWARAGDAGARRSAARVARCVALAGAVALLVNPGLLLDTVQVANDWGYTARDYFRASEPVSDPYRALGAVHHLREATLYVASAALSPRPWLGFALFAVALLGVAAQARREPRLTLALAAFAPVYLLVMAQSGLVIVRNYLPVLPVIAIFVMWGLGALWRGGRAARGLTLALCAVWLGANAWHIAATAATVGRDWSPPSLLRAVREHIQERPGERFLLSRRFVAFAAREGVSFDDLANVQSGVLREEFDQFVYLPAEYRGQVPGATRLGYFRAVIGPREVNYDYYPDWIGRGRDRRVYFLDADEARPLFEALRR